MRASAKSSAPTRTPLQPLFALANRRAIEAEIERLIGLLDVADAPSDDLEPEEDFGIDDVSHAGEATGLLRAIPRYAEDQSAGPINYAAAERERRAEELGLEQSPTGGWRQRATGGRA